MNRKYEATCCPKKPVLGNRPLLTEPQALPLEQVFKLLANGTRLRILHALARTGELCVSEIAKVLGMKPTAVSNQLQRLADRGIVEPRRNGNQILYRVIDPCVIKLLDSAWCLTEDASMRAAERSARRSTPR